MLLNILLDLFGPICCNWLFLSRQFWSSNDWWISSGYHMTEPEELGKNRHPTTRSHLCNVQNVCGVPSSGTVLPKLPQTSHMNLHEGCMKAWKGPQSPCKCTQIPSLLKHCFTRSCDQQTLKKVWYWTCCDPTPLRIDLFGRIPQEPGFTQELREGFEDETL